jgi:hypothetical protein
MEKHGTGFHGEGLPAESLSAVVVLATQGQGCKVLGDLGVPESTNLGRRWVGSEFPRSWLVADDGGRRGGEFENACGADDDGVFSQ